MGARGLGDTNGGGVDNVGERLDAVPCKWVGEHGDCRREGAVAIEVQMANGRRQLIGRW